MTTYESCRQYVNGHRKFLGTLVSIGTLIGMIVGSLMWADSRYAHSAEISDSLQDVMYSVRELRCDILHENLNELQAKEAYDELTRYDKVRKDSLERQWRRACLNTAEE